jgi:hypothetical protein
VPVNRSLTLTAQDQVTQAPIHNFPVSYTLTVAYSPTDVQAAGMS